MRSMSGLLASLLRHRQAILALLMIAVVGAIMWTARGALPAFFIGLALAFVLDGETESHNAGLWLRMRIDCRMPIPNIRLMRLDPP